MRRRPFLTRARIRLRSAAGAIDLASIMVGVIIIGIVGGVISASVFGVIGWSQDNAAAQNLDAVKTAQSVARAKTADNGGGSYLPFSKLISDGYLPANAANAVNVGTANGDSCWVAVAKSGTGKVMYSEDTNTNPKEYKPGDTTACPVDLAAMIDPVDWSKLTWDKHTLSPIFSPSSYSYHGGALIESRNGGYLYSTDGGATTYRGVGPWGTAAGTVAASYGGNSVAVLYGAAFDTTYLYLSADGRNWTSNAIPAGEPSRIMGLEGQNITLDYTDVDNGNIAGYTFSSNGGSNWISVNSPVTRTSLLGSVTSPDGANAVFIDMQGQVHSTRDSGLHWSTSTIPGELLASGNQIGASKDARHVVFVDGGGGKWVSHDFGATWQTLTAPWGGTPFISDDGNRIVMAGNGSGYAVSTDGGTTFDVKNPAGQSAPYTFAGMSSDGRSMVSPAFSAIYTGTFG